MARNGIVIRTAGPDDLRDLLHLVDRALETMSDPRLAGSKSGDRTADKTPDRVPDKAAGKVADRAGSITALLHNPDCRVLIADLADGTPAGVALLAIDVVSRALGSMTMSSTMFVDRAARRRGVGRELVSEIARCAEEAGADAVTVSLPAGDREGHRYYARLGFSSLWTSRIASVPQLVRALAPSEIAAQRRHKVLLRAKRPFRRQPAVISAARIAVTVRLERLDS